ncbi:helix-turn-helix transcriptional regulator [Streptomyces sp. AC04842]|uniref:helix-turn-helix domain-containing protein n=1 Tax=Streptomyces sp. AC04842 TaxID=2775327 RepID=UPI0020C5D346|nr:helix-turn-helix transcriptional regulator [Streptomyces sp. AC04842]
MPLDPMPDWALARQQVVGERIRDFRRAAGLSQVQLGELVGRDHKTIHRYETAQTSPSLLDLILIAHAAGVSLAELVG